MICGSIQKLFKHSISDILYKRASLLVLKLNVLKGQKGLICYGMESDRGLCIDTVVRLY